MEAQPKYETVHIEEHDDSSTEVDESLLGDEKQWEQDGLARGRSRRTCLSRLAPLRWVIDTLLLCAILGLLIRDQLRKQPANQWDFGGDFTGVGPRCRLSVATLCLGLAI